MWDGGKLLLKGCHTRITTSVYRYFIVGVVSNACGYGVYLLVTRFTGSPKASISVLYAMGTAVSFFGNRQWVFQHRGKVLPTLIRYFLTYLMGYVLNYLLLFFFVDRLGYPHQLVQAIAIFVVGGCLFLMLNFVVFSRLETSNGQLP